MGNVHVGIAGLSVYTPERFRDSAEIARLSGIPEDVIREKFGLQGNYAAAEDEHVSTMAVKAARPLLEHADPLEIDALVYFGSPHKDYAVWSVGPKIQHELGLRNAFTFEIMNVSAGGPVTLKVVKDMLTADPRLRQVLCVGASRESDLIDYNNHRSRFMFNFGDGAAAVLVRRDYPRNVILESAFITDGSFWEFVRVPAGGTVMPASERTVRERLHYLDVSDPLKMKERLDPISLDNFLRVAREALRRSGYAPEDISFLAPLHTKRSLFRQLVQGLGLTEDRAVYLERFGHLSALDPIIGLWEGQRTGKLRDGDVAVALSAGTGYSWGATVIRWGPVADDAPAAARAGAGGEVESAGA